MLFGLSHLALLLCSFSSLCFSAVVLPSSSLSSRKTLTKESDGGTTDDVIHSLESTNILHHHHQPQHQVTKDGSRYGQRWPQGDRPPEKGQEADQAEPARPAEPPEASQPQAGGSGPGERSEVQGGGRGRGKDGVLVLPLKKEPSERAADTASRRAVEPGRPDNEVLEERRAEVERRGEVESRSNGSFSNDSRSLRHGEDDDAVFLDSVLDYLIGLVEKQMLKREGESGIVSEIKSEIKSGIESGIDDLSLFGLERDENDEMLMASSHEKRSGSTSKFAGLVLGKWENGQLDAEVTGVIGKMSGQLWAMQENVTQDFHQDNKGTRYSSIAGTFPSLAKENIQGCSEHQGEVVPDLLSLPTLLVLHCVMDAALYGTSVSLDADKMALSLRALATYHTAGESRLSLWPVSREARDSGQWSSPVNLVDNSLLTTSLLDQLTRLTKEAGDKTCEAAAKSTVKAINSDTSCKSYYGVPRNKAWYSRGVPSDMMTSFMNLGLGELLRVAGQRSNDTTEQEIWEKHNQNTDKLLQTLKAMTVVFPAHLLNKDHHQARAIPSADDHKQTSANVNVTSEIKTFNKTTNKPQINDTDTQSDDIDTEINDTTDHILEEAGNEADVIDYLIQLMREEVGDEIGEDLDLENATRAASSANITGDDTPNDLVLDSVSFFTLSDYLYDVRQDSSEEDIRLVPLWISQSRDPSCTDCQTKQPAVAASSNPEEGKVKVGGRYNSVDLTSTAAVVHALLLTHSERQEDDTLMDIDIQKTLSSSLRLLSWFLAHHSQLQTALASSLFPSRFLLYWWLGRIAFLLEQHKHKFPAKHQSLSGARAEFLSAVRQDMTLRLLDDITDDGIGSDGMSRVFVDDVTMAGTEAGGGKSQSVGSARVFSSAMTLNALLSAWTQQRDDHRLEFIYNTRDEIRIAVNSLANFVSGAVEEEVRLNNHIMADLTKDCQLLPSRFPANLVTNTSSQSHDSNNQSAATMSYGVKGWLSLSDYGRLLNTSAVHSQSLDSGHSHSAFQYWTSPALTRAASLLAIAQAANLDISDKIE